MCSAFEPFIQTDVIGFSFSLHALPKCDTLQSCISKYLALLQSRNYSEIIILLCFSSVVLYLERRSKSSMQPPHNSVPSHPVGLGGSVTASHLGTSNYLANGSLLQSPRQQHRTVSGKFCSAVGWKEVVIEWLLCPGSTGPLQPLAVYLVCRHVVQKNIT